MVHLAEADLITSEFLQDFSTLAVDSWMQVNSTYAFLRSTGLPMLLHRIEQYGVDIQEPERVFDCVACKFDIWFYHLENTTGLFYTCS